MTVACPTCKAQPPQRCRDRFGIPTRDTHRSRIRAWEASQLRPACARPTPIVAHHDGTAHACVQPAGHDPADPWHQDERGTRWRTWAAAPDRGAA
jgi:hypothetical protein